MNVIDDIILSTSLFRGITEDEKKLITGKLENAACALLEYRAGDHIEYDGCAAFVVDGNADIEVTDTSATILRTVCAGDIFGIGMMYAAKQAYMTRAFARSAVKLVLIPKECLDEILEVSPHTAMNLISILSDKISFLNRRIMTFTAADTEKKVALFLYNLCFEQHSRDAVVHLADTYTAIARKLSIGRASLYRVLDKLAEDGIIERNDRDITVLKLDELGNIIRK